MSTSEESRNARNRRYGGVLKISKATKVSCSKSLFLCVPCTLRKGHFRLSVWNFYFDEILCEGLQYNVILIHNLQWYNSCRSTSLLVETIKANPNKRGKVTDGSFLLNTAIIKLEFQNSPQVRIESHRGQEGQDK